MPPIMMTVIFICTMAKKLAANIIITSIVMTLIPDAASAIELMEKYRHCHQPYVPAGADIYRASHMLAPVK